MTTPKFTTCVKAHYEVAYDLAAIMVAAVLVEEYNFRESREGDTLSEEDAVYHDRLEALYAVFNRGTSNGQRGQIIEALFTTFGLKAVICSIAECPDTTTVQFDALRDFYAGKLPTSALAAARPHLRATLLRDSFLRTLERLRSEFKPDARMRTPAEVEQSAAIANLRRQGYTVLAPGEKLPEPAAKPSKLPRGGR